MSSRRAQTLPPKMMDNKPQRGKCLTGLCVMWKILTCLVSHATLVLLVVCYCVGGAYLFQHLEKPHEIEVKKGIQNIRYNLTDKIWKFSDNTSVLSESDWIENVEQDLKSFEKQILTAMKNNGWDGDEDINKTQWTFAGSLFYSIIVITTIGYGHISPHTDWGKVTTIFYAIMGIPLMLLCLSNIGDVMATSFRFIYWRVCCYVCTRNSRPRRRSRPQPQPHRSEYPPRQRSQLASLRRSNKRSSHAMDMGASVGLSHAHSDPELRHGNQRDFYASRPELYDMYYDDLHRDGCHWDCPCRAHEQEDRRHSRGRWEHEAAATTGRHSTRSDRWSRPAPPSEEQYMRYTQSLPRGRAASRRMRAKTIDPHMNDGSQRANHVRAQQQVIPRAEEDELISKMPIISNRYALKNLKREAANTPRQFNIRSQSMPRALHVQQKDSLTPHLQNDTDNPRSKRSRAMSVMPRNPPVPSAMYNPHPHNNDHAKYMEMSDLRHSYQSHYKPTRPAATPSPECMQCYSDYYAPPVRDYYGTLAEPHHHYQPPYHQHYHHHHSHHHPHPHPSMFHQGVYRDSRKAVIRQSRTEKLPPSPRIMSPMGFAVQRQTRRISSFEYDDDSTHGAAPDYYGDMAEKNRPVPIWLCVFLVISYILGGAALFANWEQWSFLDSAYFCFITLTTIGFGDFVPAKGVKDESEQSIAYCSLYLLFGIALLAMSFNLVQEEFIANVKQVARRLGIIKEDEDNDD